MHYDYGISIDGNMHIRQTYLQNLSPQDHPNVLIHGLRFNGLEASFYHEFNQTARKNCTSVKLGLMTIHKGSVSENIRLTQHELV